MQALLKNYRQAPRKVRLVTDSVKGQNVTKAIAQLSIMNKRAAKSVRKLIESAVANAKDTSNEEIVEKDLIIENIVVDKGITFKRSRPRSKGRIAPIHKETSHIKVMLTKEGNKKDKK